MKVGSQNVFFWTYLLTFCTTVAVSAMQEETERIDRFATITLQRVVLHARPY